MSPFYLLMRIVHILTGAIWVGIAVFSAYFLMPAVGDAGPDGMKVAAALERRGFVVFMPVLATLTVLTGIWLYWRYTGGFSAAISRSHAGRAFGGGGALAILAAILGGAVLSRAAKKASTLAREAAAMPDGPNRAATLASAQRFRLRALAVARIVAVLVLITLVLMSVAILL